MNTRLSQSERLLARAFESAVRAHPAILGLRSAHEMVSELETMQGRPDLVILGNRLSAATSQNRRALGETIGTPSAARILSLLHLNVTRTAEFLCKRSFLSKRVVTSRMLELQKLGLIREHGGGFRLSLKAARIFLPLYAFEYKVRLSSRAVFQALQYRAFAERVYIVIDARFATTASTFCARLRRHAIGLILVFDDGRIELSVSGLRKPVLSEYQYIFALGSFMRRRSSGHAGAFGSERTLGRVS